MPSEKQIQANKSNSETAGVKSEEGKNIVRYNSFKHGLCSKTLISEVKELEESLEQYNSLESSLMAALKPTNAFEQACIEAMAKAQFKLKRADILEADQFSSDMDFFQGRMFLDIRNKDTFDLILRYRASLNNEISRNFDSIVKYRNFFQMDLFSKGEANEE